MAKKQKAPLTPEQVAVKAIKKSRRGDNAARFFAVLIALLLTVGTVFGAQKLATKDAAPVDSTQTGEPDDGGDDDMVGFGDDDDNNGGDTQTPDGGNDAQTPDGGNDTQTPNGGKDTQKPGTPSQAKMTAAEGVKLINEVTKTAANAKSYMLNRDADFTKAGISLMAGNRDMTPMANTVIKTFAKDNPDASVESVVGSLFGRGHEKGVKHTNGAKGDDSFKHEDGSGIWSCEKFMIKGMALTEKDLESFTDKGNGTYIFKLKADSLPEKDGKSMMHRFTNDFATMSEASKALSDNTAGAAKLSDSSVVNYTNVQMMATVKDGKLTNLQIAYRIEVKAEVKALGFTIPGAGKIDLKSEYYDFVY